MPVENVRWRSSEGSSSQHREKFVAELKLVELQGLLVGDGGFTQALEACVFECLPQEPHSPLDLLPEREVKAKVLLADRLGIPFSIWMKNVNEKDRIEYYLISMEDDSPIIKQQGSVQEDAFLSWWKKNKTTWQKKAFKKSYIDDSYYDNLLASGGLLWGGNIDGLLLDDNCQVLAVVEIRCTKVAPISYYDPAQYYREDIGTWKPVIDLSRALKVPCFLLTFEADNNDAKQNAVGVATVIDANERRIFYENNIPPAENLKKTTEEIISYFFERL